jgi:ribonucleoside-diphosphate reductase beta chain
MNESILGVNPTGFIDFNRPRYKWSVNLYDLMNANSWFPSEVNTANEKKEFENLSENEQNIYKLTFAQLSFNDSVQTLYLQDFARHTTNNILRGVLSLQSFQEVNHSNSYAVLLDASGVSSEVFDLYKTDDKLREKNERISGQFARYIEGSTSDELLLSALASVNLEGIYFLLGFGFIYTIGDKVQGARDMIQLIARDELNTHLPLFANIFKTIKKENSISIKTIDRVYEMMSEAVDIELSYGLYLAQRFPIMGITEDVIRNTIYNYANERLKIIGLDEIFPKSPNTYLQELVEKNRNINNSRANFFESNVNSYAKNSIDFDDF